MENMAHGLVANNAAGYVSKVYDQYLDMISLEPTLFTLNMQESFVAYNRPSLEEEQIRAYISRLVVGLMSMVRVLGALPIIRAASGGPAEMLAHELNNILREALNPRGNNHSNFSDFVASDRARPLLVIFDRTSDLATPLTHSCTYQSLIDDLLDHRLNKVTVNISTKAEAASVKKKTYDLNTKIDPFFAQYAGSPFPDAVEANEVELASVSQREKEIRSRPSGTHEGANLNDAITSLPEILAKKANLEAHTNILQGVMTEVAARDIPAFFEIEQGILQSGHFDKSSVLALLEDTTKGTIGDKTRLLAIVLLSQDTMTKAIEEEFTTAFTTGCQGSEEGGSVISEEDIANSLTSISFLLKLHKLQGPMGGMSVPEGGVGNSGSAISSLLNTATSMASSTMAKAASLFSKFAPLHVTRVVDSLAEGKPCTENDSYLCLDPKGKTSESFELKSQQYGEAIVFMIGGGCYSEYFNLQKLVNLTKTSQSQKSLRNVLYGGSEMLTCHNFLSQLNTLGKSQ